MWDKQADLQEGSRGDIINANGESTIACEPGTQLGQAVHDCCCCLGGVVIAEHLPTHLDKSEPVTKFPHQHLDQPAALMSEMVCTSCNVAELRRLALA